MSSQPRVLENALATADRAATDVQMLDRLALNLATLPEGIYSSVLLLSDPSSSSSTSASTPTPPSFSSTTLDGLLLQKVFASMAPGGRWRSQCGDQEWARDRLLFLTAGFLIEEASPAEGVVVTAVKPDFGGQKTVALNFRNRPRPAAAAAAAGGGGGAATVVKPVVLAPLAPPAPPPLVGAAAYGIVGLGDDLDDVGDDDDGDGDDELIDEDELMANDDLATPVQMRMRSAAPVRGESMRWLTVRTLAAECRPKAGKRRRACKDCTCGLKEQIDKEESEKRSAADQALAAAKKKAAAGVKLTADDLAEIDFTVEGRASSCGNCYLGDAFRYVFFLFPFSLFSLFSVD